MARPPIRLVVLSLAGLLAVAAFVLLRTSPDAGSTRETETRRGGSEAPAGTAAPARPTVTVDAVTVVPSEARTEVDVSGVLEPVRHVVIGAEVSGRVVSIEAREHTGVEEGELLVRLDLALPRAAVARARAALLRAEATERLAAAERARQQNLSRQGVASTAELERAESEAKSASAQVAEARAALLDAETRLAKTEIRAPFAGVVSSLDLEPGAYLNPGEPVAELADISEVEIEVGLSDREILAVADGDAVGVTVEALSGRRFEGRVVDPGRTADPQTRKYPVAVRVPNPDERLLPGMLGTVHFELGDARPVLRVPRRSVFSEFDLDYVYVLEPSPEGAFAVARRRRVTTRAVPFRPDRVDVTTGLEAGEQVATSGIGDLREGLLVQVRLFDREAARTAETPRTRAGEPTDPEPRS